MPFSPKRTWEREHFAFRYTRLLPAGVTITAATFEISVEEGSDPAAAAMISGAASISGDKVTQLVIGGVEGVRYCLLCKADFSDGQEDVTLCDTFRVTDSCD
jgi:hypothetical protein